MQSVFLVIDEESFRYEWNRHRRWWEDNNDSEMDFMSSDVVGDFIVQPGTDLLYVSVWVDDQLLEFEWSSERGSWKTQDVKGVEVHLKARFYAGSDFEADGDLVGSCILVCMCTWPP